jgi:hypothetical protein
LTEERLTPKERAASVLVAPRRRVSTIFFLTVGCSVDDLLGIMDA